MSLPKYITMHEIGYGKASNILSLVLLVKTIFKKQLVTCCSWDSNWGFTMIHVIGQTGPIDTDSLSNRLRL